MFRADGTKCHILQQQKFKQLNGAIKARGTNPFTLYFVQPRKMEWDRDFDQFGDQVSELPSSSLCFDFVPQQLD